MRRTGFNPTPIVLAVILGGMAETGFSQSLIMARGNVLGYYLSRPISMTLRILIAAALFWPMVKWTAARLRRNRGRRK